MTNFTDLGLTEPLLRALTAEGYTTPTPIQAQAIPHVAAGRDLLGIAQTGTGKTAAFALPILQRLAADPPRAARAAAACLVLSADARARQPDRRELPHLRPPPAASRVAVVFGGVSHGPQIRALRRGVDILVATPGPPARPHRAAHAARSTGVEILVLDEADHMLDLGFIHADPPHRRRRCRRKRQTLFFSATMPKEIGRLPTTLLTDPAQVAVTPVGHHRRAASSSA